MDGTAQARALGLLGRFNDDLTQVFDSTFGTQWAEIEEMTAISAIAADSRVTTRRLAEITRLNRRAVSRMVARLREHNLVLTRPSDRDGRAVEVVFTPSGQRRVEALRTSILGFYLANAAIAREIRDGLGSASAPLRPPAPTDPLDLLRRVCEAGVALVRSMPDAASQGQLAARQRAALVQIASSTDTRPHDLAAALQVSRAAATYIVDQLCAKGYALRRRDLVPADRRAVVVQATPRGLTAVQAVISGIERQADSLAHLFAELADFAELAAGGDQLAIDTAAGATGR
ncbi:MarR family winged helix-turn-helix transcriptional regulator [Microbacterium invictum]|uniref:MarR family transcriptional regulator n=1 Tax=Microbacterium invictum TaxID=515415 RepID=A0ABZ0V7P6_9MICO|nr:MarR family transcriptional regulator [Microbacterium invictum]WQB69640.1 MarR family transcriptional regulator [Microbacterium invictum]